MNIRVTQNSISRQYMKNMNNTLSQMNKLQNQYTTGRKFLRASENSLGAARAISVRKSLANLDTYEDNLGTAKGIFSTAEDTLTTISTEITSVTTKILSGVNGDKSQSEMDAIATELEGVANNMIKDMNLEYADRNLFGGTNNSSVAFAYVETSGLVTFNGEAVNTDSAIVDEDNKYYLSNEHITGTTITAATDLSTLDASKVYCVDNAALDYTTNAPDITLTGSTVPIQDMINSGQIVRFDANNPIEVIDGENYYNHPDISATTITSENTDTQNANLIAAGTLSSPCYIDFDDVTVTGGVSTFTSGSGTVTDITADIASGKIVVSSNLVTTPDGKVYTNLTQISEGKAGNINAKSFNGTDSILIDVGLGIEFDDDGVVDPSTAMDISLNGAELLGCGTDGDGDSKNVIQLTFDAAAALRDGDTGTATRLIDKLNAAKSTLLNGITELGVVQTAIEYNLSSIETQRANLDEAQVSAEGMSVEEQAAAITEYKLVEAAYNATLSMGASIVPTSLFDFIR